MNRILQKTVIVLVLAVLAGFVRWSQSVMDRNKIIRFINDKPEFLPRGEMLRTFGMGYNGLIGDWLWIRSVLYFGRRVMDDDNPYFRYALQSGEVACDGEEMNHAAHSHSLEAVLENMTGRGHQSVVSYRKPDFQSPDSVFLVDEDLKKVLYKFDCRGLVDDIYPLLDRVTTVDTGFVFPYIFGGVYVMHETGEMNSAIGLLMKGKKYNPENWQFPFYLGWIYWMYKGDMDSAYRFLGEAIQKQGCPDFVGHLYAAISKHENKLSVTKMYLEGILQNTENEEMKIQIQKILNGLEEAGRRTDIVRSR